MRYDLEKKIIGYALVNKEVLDDYPIEKKWFQQKELSQIAEALEKIKSRFSEFQEIEAEVKSSYPFTKVTAEALDELQYNAYSVTNYATLVHSLKREYYKRQMIEVSSQYAKMPNADNMESLKKATKELDELEDEVKKDGDLNESSEELHYQLENEMEDGIKTFKEFDRILGYGIEGARVIVAAGRPGTGKGNPNWVEIPTPEGNKKMGDLVVGDYVFDRYGKPTKITGVYPRGKLETYKVTLNDGRSTIVDGDHIWSHFSKSGSGNESLIDKTTREMYKAGTHLKKKKNNGKFGHHAKYSIPTNGAVEFKSNTHYIDPYVIGAFIGDGCLTERRLTISSNDEPVARKIADILGVETIAQRKGNFSWEFKLNEQEKNKKWIQTKDLLSDLPELTTYSHLKSIPEKYLFTDTGNRMKLLNGLFDTDGHATRSTDRLHVGYTTTSKKLMEQIRWLLQSCGYLNTVALDKREGRRHCYNIKVLAQPDELIELFTLDVKKAAITSNMKKRRRKYDRIAIKSIEKTGIKEEVTCISVDNEEQLYLCNDFIVTHNTAWGVSASINGLEKNEMPFIDFFSLEMKQLHMYKRFISNVAQINSYKLKNPKKDLDNKQKAKVIERDQYLKSTNLKIHDDKFYLDDIIAQIKKTHRKANGMQQLVFIDYLQLIKNKGSFQSRQIEIGHITRGLKQVANNLNIPIIVFAQLGRGAEQKERPTLTDLRESGDIENDADIVCLMHKDKEEENIIHFEVAKNRDGMIGTIDFNFIKSQMYFEEIEK